MTEYGTFLEYNAKVDDVKDNMKSILEKVKNADLFFQTVPVHDNSVLSRTLYYRNPGSEEERDLCRS